MIKALLFFVLLFVFRGTISASDSSYIQVHFLYGSKPHQDFRTAESKWFGGRLGGHAGIETDSNFVIDFIPHGDLHIFSHKTKRHSKFTTHTSTTFFEIFGGEKDSVSFTSISIPISIRQKEMLDSLSLAYRTNTPYDYAFIGMRCGAATYDLLAQIGVVKQYPHRKTRRKIFYPRKIRRKLTKMALEHGWKVEKQTGSTHRLWERE